MDELPLNTNQVACHLKFQSSFDESLHYKYHDHRVSAGEQSLLNRLCYCYDSSGHDGEIAVLRITGRKLILNH